MGADRVQRRMWWTIAIVAAAAGVALRCWHTHRDPLWLDEAYSAYAADHGFAFLWHVVPRYETHPPLYYSIVRLWSLAFGDTLAVRRMLGVACGVAAIGATGAAAAMLAALLRWSEAARLRLMAITVVLVALNPMQVVLSRQVRPYPVIAFVYAAGVAVVLRLAIDTRERRRLHQGWLAAATVIEALLLWLHTLGPLFGAALALALALLVARRGMARRDLLALLATQVAAGLLYLPAFLIMLEQAPAWVRTTWLRFSTHDLAATIGLVYLSWNRIAQVAAMVFGVAGAIRLARQGDPGRRAAAALVVLAVAPPLAAILISLAISPVFLVRTVDAATLPAAILFAAAITWPRPLLWVAATALVPIASEAALDREFASTPPVQDWYGVLDWLLPRFAPGDIVWAYPNEGALPLAYALRDRGRTLPVRPIPGAVPAFGLGGYYVTGSQGVVSLYPREIAALMRTPAATRPATIWLLRVGPWNYDPGDRMLRALGAGRVEIARWRSNQIMLIGLRRRDLPPVAPPEQPQP